MPIATGSGGSHHKLFDQPWQSWPAHVSDQCLIQAAEVLEKALMSLKLPSDMKSTVEMLMDRLQSRKKELYQRAKSSESVLATKIDPRLGMAVLESVLLA